MTEIQYLLFDLDDTLYTNTSGLFADVGQRIIDWTARALRISQDEAAALRRNYYRAYGTTMAGLIHNHPDADIDDYLAYVHDIDVTRYLHPDPKLDAMLDRLPAPKAIFTNSITGWAERVTDRLGVRHHFEHIFDVRAVGYRSKPDPQTYTRVLDTLGLPGTACVMLDDQASYLAGAAKTGIHTVLVHAGSEVTTGVDYAVDHILEAQPILERLLNHG
jgi:putative hydrolase of the HAD superfamily